VFALAGLACLAYAVSRLARRTGRDPAVATWLAAASPFALVHGIGGAHLDLGVAALMALAVLSALRGQWLVGSVMVGAAAAIKAPAVVADVAVVLAWVSQTTAGTAPVHLRVRRAVQVAGVSVATVLGLGVVSGLGIGWVSGLMTPLRHLSPLSPSTETALHLGRLVGVRMVTPVHELAVVLLVVVVGWVGLRAPARNAADVVRAAAVVMAATLLLSPVVHYWYYFWCLPFLASAALSSRVRRGVLGMTAALGLLAPADFSAGHLSFSGTLVVIGLGAGAASFFLPRGHGRRPEVDRL
jgi:alpha-1,6-mannosyltransferase